MGYGFRRYSPAGRWGIYRSEIEQRLASELKEAKAEFGYESIKIQYVKPAETSHYTPDFVLANGIIIEAKGGEFLSVDRKKHLLIHEQHPDLDIRFVFQTPHRKLSPQSKTTYARWCEQHGFEWAAKAIPVGWILEKPKPGRSLPGKDPSGVPHDPEC